MTSDDCTDIESSLGYLISLSGITSPLAHRRLNGIENSLSMLGRRWRPEIALDPATEGRLLAWVGAIPPEDDDLRSLRERPTPYLDGAVRDDSVRESWVRLLLTPSYRVLA